MLRNESGLEPRGVAILLLPYEPERKHARIIVPDNIQERKSAADIRATVVAIGPNAWHDEPGTRAEVGDKVLVTAYAGMMARGTADGVLYRIVNDRDIFCRIIEEREVENG